jgi:hypothetical protein
MRPTQVKLATRRQPGRDYRTVDQDRPHLQGAVTKNIVRKTDMAFNQRLGNIWLIGIVLVMLTAWPSSPVQAGGEPVYCDCSPVARPADWECGQPK